MKSNIETTWKLNPMSFWTVYMCPSFNYHTHINLIEIFIFVTQKWRTQIFLYECGLIFLGSGLGQSHELLQDTNIWKNFTASRMRMPNLTNPQIQGNKEHTKDIKMLFLKKFSSTTWKKFLLVIPHLAFGIHDMGNQSFSRKPLKIGLKNWFANFYD